MANNVLYGFYDLKSVFDQQVSNSLIPTINQAVDRTLAEHERQSGALFSLIARQTTTPSMRYITPGNETLQPGEEDGRYLPTQGGTSYDVAFPLQFAGTAWGANRTARAKMTVQTVNNILAQKITADIRWRRNHIIAAMLDNTGFTFVDKEFGSLAVKPLANGDTNTYSIMTGGDSGATDNHYIAQTSVVNTANNPLPALREELLEHPENGGDVVLFAATGMAGDIKGLASFTDAPDPDITQGIGTSYLSGKLGVPVPGNVVGKADGIWIVEWKGLPAGYAFAVTTEGEPVLGARHQPEAELQGFKRIGQDTKTPFTEDQYERQEGYGAWNRVGGAVLYAGTSNTYAVPASYVTPIG